MNPQTQQLVALLVDDVTGRLITALRRSPSTAPQLEKETGASQRTIAQTLELLQAHGIVEPQQAQTGTPGRPSRIWRLAADEELAAFERTCDEFKALMQRKQLDDFTTTTAEE